MAQRAYNDPEYKRAKARLKAVHIECWYPGCTNRATTPDHQPPLASHNHRRGTNCCELRPACQACNGADGARLRNQRSSSGYDWP